jgi:hypothetical protein
VFAFVAAALSVLFGSFAVARLYILFEKNCGHSFVGFACGLGSLSSAPLWMPVKGYADPAPEPDPDVWDWMRVVEVKPEHELRVSWWMPIRGVELIHPNQ